MSSNLVIKPWGTYEILYAELYVCVKKIIVHANHKFSLQYHNQRKEVWTITKGNGFVHMAPPQRPTDTFRFSVKEGSVVEIEIGYIHRMEADSNGIEFIEVQYGEPNEDDIVRISDDFRKNLIVSRTSR